MNNKELIRRALTGDKKAQEECTAKGIVLPCPLCGDDVTITEIPAHKHCIVNLPEYGGWLALSSAIIALTQSAEMM